MPRGDGSGPMGYGPMTGRAAGYCQGLGAPGFQSAGLVGGFAGGRGIRRGFRGRGWRNWSQGYSWPGYVALAAGPRPAWSFDPVTEQRELAGRAEALKTELEFIKKRLSDMERAVETE